MVLTSKSTEQRSNIYTNTRSFAEKNTKNSCKFKVRQTYKNEADMPQPGYYDTKKAFEKTFGEEVVNAVNMDKDLDRKDIFTGNVDPSCWQQLDQQKVKNKWVKNEVPQIHMEYENMMSREAQTVQHGLTGIKWIFVKSADQIAREELNQARLDHIKDLEGKEKPKAQPQELIDITSEPKMQEFTFDIMKMRDCTALYKTGITMLGEKIEKELKKPDDLAQLYAS